MTTPQVNRLYRLPNGTIFTDGSDTLFVKLAPGRFVRHDAEDACEECGSVTRNAANLHTAEMRGVHICEIQDVIVIAYPEQLQARIHRHEEA